MRDGISGRAARLQEEIMERARDGFETRMLEGRTLDAANDPLIAGARPASGWDPFEIWRTRVKDAREQDSTDGDQTTS
jgi:hypothetical protein